MAITSYSELKTAVYGWLNVASTDFSGTLIDDLIMAGEKKIFRQLRVRSMETALSATISSGVIAVPADLVELKFAYISHSGESTFLKRKTAEWIYSAYPQRGAEGLPICIARDAGNFIFGPYPDSTYSVAGVYYKRLTAVASSANALFTANPDLYLWAALSEADVMLGRDPRIQIWESKYQRAAADLNAEERGEEYSGGGLQVSLG